MASNRAILPDLRGEKTQQGTPGLLLSSPETAFFDENPAQTTISYTYDSLYRLTDAVYSNGFEFHYTYDPAGNRLTQTTCAPSVPCSTTYYGYWLRSQCPCSYHKGCLNLVEDRHWHIGAGNAGGANCMG